MMAAASNSQSGSTPPTPALDDYSVYSHLTDEELLQLVIERSLNETRNNTVSATPPTLPPQPVTRTCNHYSSHNPPVDYSSPNPPAERPPDPYGLVFSSFFWNCQCSREETTEGTVFVPSVVSFFCTLVIFYLSFCILFNKMTKTQWSTLKASFWWKTLWCALIGCCLGTGTTLMGRSVASWLALGRGCWRTVTQTAAFSMLFQNLRSESPAFCSMLTN